MYYVHIDRNTGKVCGLIAIPKSIQRGGALLKIVNMINVHITYCTVYRGMELKVTSEGLRSPERGR